jgi:hypothetical protein
MAKHFWNILGRIANVLQVSGGLPEPLNSLVRRLIGGSLVFAAIALVQRWFQTFSQLDPALRWTCATAVVATIVLTVIWGTVGIGALLSRTKSAPAPSLASREDVSAWQESTERHLNEISQEVAFVKAALAPKATAELKPLSPSELDEAGIRWSWNGHEPQGPFCPYHGEPLKHVRHLGSNTVDAYSNFEESYLGSSGWFACPIDQKEFRVQEHMQVKDLRARVGDRFRARYGLSTKEAKAGPVKFSPEAIDAFGSIFPGLLPADQRYQTILPNGNLKWWTKKEIDGLPAAQREKLDKDLLDWWRQGKDPS